MIVLDNECVRCTRILKEEKYYLIGSYYCRACMTWIENDHEWVNVLASIGHFRQIEN